MCGFCDWFTSLFQKNSSNPIEIGKTVAITATGYTKPPEQDSRMRPDQQLTQNFSLYSLTRTDHTELQAMNRDLTDEQVKKLTSLAELMEEIRAVINLPIIPDDGYRCPQLNKVDGGVATSQHALCEACDWIPEGISTIDKLYPIFKQVWDAAKAKKFKFGQLIFEESTHIAGNAWIHVSLGYPLRDLDKCGQILHMRQGHYELFDTIPQSA